MLLSEELCHCRDRSIVPVTLCPRDLVSLHLCVPEAALSAALAEQSNDPGEPPSFGEAQMGL